MNTFPIQSVIMDHPTNPELKIIGAAVPHALAAHLVTELERRLILDVRSGNLVFVDVLAETITMEMHTAAMDGVRLAHLVHMDHEVLAPAADGQAPVEQVTFIYDAPEGIDKLDALRAAIDNSISATAKVNYAFISGARDFLKPDTGDRRFFAVELGTPWTRDNESVACALLLTSLEVPADVIASWTDEQAQLAHEWAIALHYHASDNDDVVVPPRPDFLDHFAEVQG